MSKIAFTLIELILVVILIGLISFLVIRLPSFVSSKEVTVLTLRKYLYPNGKFYLFSNGDEIAVKDKNLTLNLNFETPEVYVYNGNYFKQKEFNDLGNKKVIFKYIVKNGIGESFILQNGNKFYVFKPFLIKEFNSFSAAKDFFLLRNYQPKIGDYY